LVNIKRIKDEFFENKKVIFVLKWAYND